MRAVIVAACVAFVVAMTTARNRITAPTLPRPNQLMSRTNETCVLPTVCPLVAGKYSAITPKTAPTTSWRFSVPRLLRPRLLRVRTLR